MYIDPALADKCVHSSITPKFLTKIRFDVHILDRDGYTLLYLVKYDEMLQYNERVCADFKSAVKEPLDGFTALHFNTTNAYCMDVSSSMVSTHFLTDVIRLAKGALVTQGVRSTFEIGGNVYQREPHDSRELKEDYFTADVLRAGLEPVIWGLTERVSQAIAPVLFVLN
jgi:hypothetical protein